MNTQSELSKRVATGIVGGSVLLLLIVFGGWPGIFLLTTILSLGMIFEFAKITFSLPDATEKLYVLLCTAWLVSFLNLLASGSELELLMVCFLGLFAYFLLTAGRQAPADFTTHFKECASWT